MADIRTFTVPPSVEELAAAVRVLQSNFSGTAVVTETGTATDLTAAQICVTVFYKLSA